MCSFPTLSTEDMGLSKQNQSPPPSSALEHTYRYDIMSGGENPGLIMSSQF